MLYAKHLDPHLRLHAVLTASSQNQIRRQKFKVRNYYSKHCKNSFHKLTIQSCGKYIQCINISGIKSELHHRESRRHEIVIYACI